MTLIAISVHLKYSLRNIQSRNSKLKRISMRILCILTAFVCAAGTGVTQSIAESMDYDEGIQMIVPGSLESTESVMVQYGLNNEIKRVSEERQSTVKMRSSVEVGLGRSHSKARSSNDEILHERQNFRRPILEHDTSATPMQRDPLSIIKGHQLTVVGKSHVRLTSEENEVDTDSSAETDETEKVIADQGTNSVKSADEGAIQAATVNQTESTSIEEDISATTTTLTPHQEDITPSTKADETDVSETKKKAEPLTSPDTVNVAADETDVSETKKKAEPLTSPGTVIATPDKSGGSVPSSPAKKIPERGDTATAPDGKDTDKGKLIAPVQVGDTAAVAPGIDSSDSSQEIIEVIEEGDGGQWKPLTPAFKVLFAVTGLLIFTIIVGVRSWLNKRSSIKNADTSEPEYDQLLPKDARERDMEAGSSGADEAWGEDWEEDQDENIGTHSNSNSNNNPSNGNGPVSSNRDRPNVIGSQFLSKSKSDKSKDFEVSSSSAFSSSPSSTALPGYQLPTRSSGGLGDRTNNNNSNGPGHSVKRSGSNDDIELSKPIAAPLSAASDYASYRDQKYSNNSSSGGGNNSSASSPSLLSAPCPPPLSSFSASSAGHFAGAKEVATMKGGLGLGSSSGLGLGGRDGGDRGEGRVAPPRVSKPPPSAASDTDFFASIGISAAPKFQPAATSARSTPVMGLSSLGPTVSSIAKGSASTSTSAQRIGNQRAPEVSKVSMSIVDLGREDGDGEGDGDAAWGTDDDLDFDE